jgi:O-antigen ligase
MKSIFNYSAPIINLAYACLISLAILAGINYFGVAMTGSILLIWATLAYWPKLKQGIPYFPGTLTTWAMTWLIWLVILVWISKTPYSSWFYFWTLSGLPIALLTWQTLEQPDAIWIWLRKVLWLGAAVLSISGILQVTSNETLRAHGPLIDPNAYAATLNLLWFPLAARFLAIDLRLTSRLSRYAMGTTLLLLGLAFFAANSRGALISWALIVPLLLWLNRGCMQFSLKAWLLLGLWLLAFGIMHLFTSHNLNHITALNTDSLSARLLLWQSTWQMIQIHPWLGSGLGTWSLYYPAFRSYTEWGSTGYYAHNDYLQFAAEGGVVTLILFLIGIALTINLLRRVTKLHNKQAVEIEAIGLLLGVVAISLHAFVNFIFYHAFINILTGLFIGRTWQILIGDNRLKILVIPAFTYNSRRLIAVLLITIAGGQLILHGVAGLLNCNHPTINALHRINPKINEYEIARLIHAIRPNEPIPQNLVLRYMAQGVDEAGLFGKATQRDVLLETISAYDAARIRMPNRTQLGAEEAMLLIEQRKLLPNTEALQLAEKTALETLKLDPRHAESIIALAEVQFSTGNKAAGLNIISQAVPHLFRIRDRRLLETIYVQHWLLPTVDPKLNTMEQALRKIMPYTIEGNSGENPALYAQVDTYLHELMQPSSVNPPARIILPTPK